MKLLLCTFGLIVLLVVVESIPAEVSQPSLRKKGSSGGGFGSGFGGGYGGGYGGSFVEIPHYVYVPEYQYVEHGQGHGHGHGHGHGCFFRSSGKSSGCSGSDLSEIAGYLYLLDKFSRIAKPATKPAVPGSESGGYQYPKPPNAANAEIILNRLRGKTLTNTLDKA